MTTQFWWIFDVLVLVVAIYFIYSNAKRGMTKVLVMCIGYIVATVVSSVLSAVSASTLYEILARDSNLEAIEEMNREFDAAQVLADTINDQRYGVTLEKSTVEAFLLPPDTADCIPKLYDHIVRKSGYEPVAQLRFHYLLQDAFIEAYSETMLDYLPDYAAAQLREICAEDSSVMYTIIENMYSSTVSARSAATYIEDTFVQKSTIEVFRIFIYLILFSIIMVFAALLASMLEHRLFFNVSQITDHLLGGVLGLIEAGVMLVLLTIVTRMLILLGGGKLFCFNEETVMASKLFRYLYEQLGILL